MLLADRVGEQPGAGYTSPARGIGGRLVRAAVARAEMSGETVLPWCPYARKLLEKHPDLAAGVTIDWSDPPAG